MAKAKTFTRSITREVVDKVPGYVELNLTPEEAGTLLDIMNVIGGSPERSPRKHADSIRTALMDAGVECPEHRKDGRLNAIYYRDFDYGQ